MSSHVLRCRACSVQGALAHPKPTLPHALPPLQFAELHSFLTSVQNSFTYFDKVGYYWASSFPRAECPRQPVSPGQSAIPFTSQPGAHMRSKS